MQKRLLIRTLLVLIGMLWLQPVAYAASDSGRVKIRKRTTLIKAPTAGVGEMDAEYNADKANVLSQKRRSLIEDIKRFIRDARDNEQIAELNLRLGGLYMEDYYAGMAKAQSDFDIRTAAWEKSKKGRAPQLDVSEAKASLVKARTLYKDLLRRAPKHPRRDEVLYFLAISSMDDGKIKEGMSYLQRIIAEMPQSRYVNDSLIQLADHSFEINQFRAAEAYYDKLIARKHLPLLPYAVYKKGWCAHNREAFAEAIKQFKWVIAFADSESDNSALRIRGEAIRDISLPFAELKATDDAVDFFRALGAPHHRQGLENLAAIYFDKGTHADAVRLYELLLTLDPNYAKNPTYDIQIIESMKLTNKEEAALARLFSRMGNYLKGSNWYDLNSNKPATVQGAFSAFEELTRNYAFRYHALAQKTKNESLYNRTKAIYSKYVEHFPQTDHTSKVRFYLAEIQYKQLLYPQAAENYYKVYQDPRAGKLRFDGIRYALQSLDAQLNIDRKKSGLGELSSKTTSKLAAKDEESLQLLAYSPVEARFIEIADEYLKNFSSARDAGDVLYEQSYLRYVHHDFVDAYRGFWTLVQKFPTHTTAVPSAYLILDILNRRKEYPKLIAACLKFLDTPELKKGKFGADVSDILRKSELKRISMLESQNLFKEAGDNYLEYTKTYGGQDEVLFEKALYNAAISYNKAGLMLAAVEVQERFLRRFPKSGYKETMLLQVAKSYETLANFDKSGRYFEEFANAFPRHAQAKNALRLAGVYLAGSGYAERAEGIFVRFLRAHPADAKLVERDILSLFESLGAHDKMLSYYMAARAGKGVSAGDYLAYTVDAAELAASKNGGKLPESLMNDARRVSEKYGPDIRRSPKGTEALAKVRFWWVSQREALFHKYKLALPQATLEANLKRKLLLLRELETEYGKIAALGNAEWGLGAIYKTASAYHHLAESVMSAPVPPDLGPDQLDGYRAELKRQMIDPFNDKARAFAASCLDKAQEHGVLSPWTAGCYRIASQIEPERYPKIRTFYLPPMMLALQMPRKEAKTEAGSLRHFAYPFYSSQLFTPNRQLASLSPVDLPAIWDLSGDSENTVAPSATSYEVLTNERRNILKSSYDSEKPDDIRKGATYSFLNLMRLVSSAKAIPLIESAIQRDTDNTALVDLLGLAYMEAGRLAAANVCWLSLVARGAATSSVWNNLGVAAARSGNETQAIAYFLEGAKLPGAKEPFVNLGFIALKYRNGNEAKNYFRKALAVEEEDVAAQVGLAVAQLQNRELEEAKDRLLELSRRYNKDPYLKLSLGYFLIDVEQEHQIAQKIVADYMDSQSLEKDMTFRTLLLEARRRPGTAPGEVDSDLPDIQ